MAVLILFFRGWLVPAQRTTLGFALDGTRVWVCAREIDLLCMFVCVSSVCTCDIVREEIWPSSALCTPLSDLISLTHVKRSTFFPFPFFFFNFRPMRLSYKAHPPAPLPPRPSRCTTAGWQSSSWATAFPLAGQRGAFLARRYKSFRDLK